MAKLRNILFIVLFIPLLLILIWYFAVPLNIVEDQIDRALLNSGNNNIKLSMVELRKGLLFALYADSLDMNIDNKPAVQITEFTGRFTPRYLADRQLAFLLNGKMGTGDVSGIVKLPVEGNITVDRAELSAIPYLTRLGIAIKGTLSSDIVLKDEKVTVLFEVPDLDIAEGALAAIPFLNTFHKMQGALSLINDRIEFDSVSLEGEKGFARLRGNITKGIMDLDLEIMPEAGKLNALESMIISTYFVSPGYFVIPLNGPLL